MEVVLSVKKVLETFWQVISDKTDDKELNLELAKMSVDEVQIKALEFAEDDNRFKSLKRTKINLRQNSETHKLFWQIQFLLDWIEDDYTTGTMGFMDIDDETGALISKSYLPR